MNHPICFDWLRVTYGPFWPITARTGHCRRQSRPIRISQSVFPMPRPLWIGMRPISIYLLKGQKLLAPTVLTLVRTSSPSGGVNCAAKFKCLCSDLWDGGSLRLRRWSLTVWGTGCDVRAVTAETSVANPVESVSGGRWYDLSCQLGGPLTTEPPYPKDSTPSRVGSSTPP